MTDGTDTASVVTWKKLLSVVPMPVRNMWCAHTTIDQRAQRHHRGHHQPVAPERAAVRAR